MICPRCNTHLQISNTHDIEIDYCPNCRGVWLDKGELEKIIERSSQYSSPYSEHNSHYERHDEHYDDKHHHGQQEYGHHSKRRKGFLSDLFDF